MRNKSWRVTYKASYKPQGNRYSVVMRGKKLHVSCRHWKWLVSSNGNPLPAKELTGRRWSMQQGVCRSPCRAITALSNAAVRIYPAFQINSGTLGHHWPARCKPSSLSPCCDSFTCLPWMSALAVAFIFFLAVRVRWPWNPQCCLLQWGCSIHM